MDDPDYEQEQENESGIDMHDCWHVCHPLPSDELRRTEDERSAKSYNANTISRTPDQ